MDAAGEVKAARVVKPLSQKKLQKYQAEHENRGVCYLSRVPPYLKPSALREMLSGMGTDVLRVYLAAHQCGHTALARRSPCGHSPLQKPTHSLRAALWAREESAGAAWMPRRGCGGCSGLPTAADLAVSPQAAGLGAALTTAILGTPILATAMLAVVLRAMAGGGELGAHEACQGGRQQEEELYRGVGGVF